jgi:hypothetical protein
MPKSGQTSPNEPNLSKLLCATFPSAQKVVPPPRSIGVLTRTRTVPQKRWKLPNELNVLALIKGAEHYIFVYDDDSRAELIDAFRDQAADPQLSLSWFDAMVLTNKAREQETMEATPLEPAEPRSRI